MEDYKSIEIVTCIGGGASDSSDVATAITAVVSHLFGWADAFITVGAALNEDEEYIGFERRLRVLTSCPAYQEDKIDQLLLKAREWIGTTVITIDGRIRYHRVEEPRAQPAEEPGAPDEIENLPGVPVPLIYGTDGATAAAWQEISNVEISRIAEAVASQRLRWARSTYFQPHLN